MNMMSQDGPFKRTLTILIPCFNEQDALPTLFERMNSLISESPKSVEYSLLFVDDGSKDATQQLIRAFSHKHEYAEFIFLSRNFGKEKAMIAGIEHVHTDGMVIIDADLQDPPELIPQMVDLWLQGYEDVYARRRRRDGDGPFKRATAHLYYRLLQKLAKIDIQKDTGDFRLLDRKCINALKQLKESERNSKALFSWIGFKKIEFLYDRDKRIAGKSKWNIFQLIYLAVNGITSFSTAPLKISTMTGLITSLAAIIYASFILPRTVVLGTDVPGYASLIVIILFLGGIQLLCLGIIGEYLGRIFMQTKNRPNYLVEESHMRNDDLT